MLVYCNGDYNTLFKKFGACDYQYLFEVEENTNTYTGKCRIKRWKVNKENRWRKRKEKAEHIYNKVKNKNGVKNIKKLLSYKHFNVINYEKFLKYLDKSQSFEDFLENITGNKTDSNTLMSLITELVTNDEYFKMINEHIDSFSNHGKQITINKYIEALRIYLTKCGYLNDNTSPASIIRILDVITENAPNTEDEPKIELKYSHNRTYYNKLTSEILEREDLKYMTDIIKKAYEKTLSENEREEDGSDNINV